MRDLREDISQKVRPPIFGVAFQGLIGIETRSNATSPRTALKHWQHGRSTTSQVIAMPAKLVRRANRDVMATARKLAVIVPARVEPAYIENLPLEPVQLP